MEQKKRNSKETLKKDTIIAKMRERKGKTQEKNNREFKRKKRMKR